MTPKSSDIFEPNQPVSLMAILSWGQGHSSTSSTTSSSSKRTSSMADNTRESKGYDTTSEMHHEVSEVSKKSRKEWSRRETPDLRKQWPAYHLFYVYFFNHWNTWVQQFPYRLKRIRVSCNDIFFVKDSLTAAILNYFATFSSLHFQMQSFCDIAYGAVPCCFYGLA